MSTIARRNPIRSAVLGLVALGLAVTGVFRLDSLPLVGERGIPYEAAFLDAGGLAAGDPVEVAGVSVGTVREIRIEREQVVVEFEVEEGVSLGTETQVSVKVGTLLGSKYLDVVPAGTGRIRADARVPQARTTEAYDVVSAFADLTETTERLDTEEIAHSLDTISTMFEDSPEEVRAAVRGVTGFSQTIARRDETIRSLMQHAAGTTRVLSERSGDVAALVRDATLLATELQRRSAAIHGILVHTRTLAEELSALARENQATLAPALKELQGVVDVLVIHQQDLRATVRNVATYGRVFVNTLGSGPWFDSWLPNTPDTVSGTSLR